MNSIPHHSSPQNGNPQSAARPHPPNIAPGKRSAAAAHAPGPHPLTPDETVEFVKALRRRLLINGLKSLWREYKGFIVSLITMLMLFILFFIATLTTFDQESSDEDETGEEEEETDEDLPMELVYIFGTLLVMLGYMILLAGLFHGMTDVTRITNYARNDREYLYGAPLEREALLRFNLRRNLVYASVCGMVVFTVLFFFVREEPVYLRALVAYCIFNFCLGQILLILNVNAENHRRMNTAAVGGIHARKIPRDRWQWLAALTTAVSPVIIFCLMFYPYPGIVIIVLLLPAYRFWKRTVLPGRLIRWHEDLSKVYVPPSDRAAAATRYRHGYEVREMPEKTRWYRRGIFDKKRYHMKEEGSGYDALKEKSNVVNERTNYNLHLHLSKLVVPVTILGSILLYPDYVSIAIFVAGFLLVATMIALVSYGAQIPFQENKSNFELMYLLPISGRELILDSFFKLAIIMLSIPTAIVAFFLVAYWNSLTPGDAMAITGFYLFFSLNALIFLAYSHYADTTHRRGMMGKSTVQGSGPNPLTFIFLIFQMGACVGIIVILDMLANTVILVFMVDVPLCFLPFYTITRAVKEYDSLSKKADA